MKQSVIVMVIALVMTVGIRVSAGETVSLANGEWPPYASRSLPGYGTMSRIITRAFALSGVDVEYTFFDSWKRCYVLAKKGEFDGSLTWARTDEREKDFHFAEPVIFHENVFFHLKSKPFDWQGIHDLLKRRISVTSSYSYSHEFDRAVTEGKIRPFIVYTDINNFQILLKGRIDIFLMDKKVGYHLLKTAYPPEIRERITHHPKPLEWTASGLVISKQIPQDRADRLIRAFSQGLARLKKKGEYARLLSSP